MKPFDLERMKEVGLKARELYSSDAPRVGVKLTEQVIENLATGGKSAFERLSPALQYQIVNMLGFSGLRPVQEQAAHALLSGKNAVVLAPTAGGKTEAAFFPALSRMDSEDWRPVSVLYLSPIRALLNNQETRVSKYAQMLGRRAFKWHGDIKAGPRKRFLQDPADILLTTPES